MELFYRKYGSGVPLIIIHGLYGASDNWVTVGRALAEEFEVYIIDQRNHGRSPHSEEHNYALMRDDLLEFMDKQGLEKAIIVGHSMGGKTAMFFSVAYPERVQSLIVVDIAPKSYLNVDGFEQQTIDHKKILKAMSSVDFNQIKSRTDVDVHLASMLDESRTRQFLLKNLRMEKDNSFYWGLNVESLEKNINYILEGLNSDDSGHEKEVVGFPVLFIRGEKSDYISTEDIDSIYNIFPYAEMATVSNAGHWVHAEQPQLLIKNILYFVSQ